MALSLGKLTVLLGAGIVGSVIAKEGRLPDVSTLLSGAFKVVLKPITSNDSAPAVKKPNNDALLAQVDNLRQQLQLLHKDRSITIVNTTGTGPRKFVTVIVIVVVGYGYIWWKGWKLPDMMFATRRSLSDACTSVGNQLGKLYESVEDAKKKLSARMNGLDISLDECAALSEHTREEVSVIQQEANTISVDFKSVRTAVHVLESKLKEIEGKQVATTEGVNKLCQFTLSMEKKRTPEYIQAPSKPALELPPVSPSSRAPSKLALELPPVSPSSRAPSKPALELPPVSPSSRGTPSSYSRLSIEPPSLALSSKTGPLTRTLSTDPPSSSYSAGTHKETSPDAKEINLSSSNVDSIKVVTAENKSNGSSSGLFGRFSGAYAPFLSRTRSATDALVQQTRSTQ